MQFDIEFFTDKKGKKPVQDFLDRISQKNKHLWIQAISGLRKIRHRNYQKEPLSKALGGNLFEIRTKSGNNILRIIYTFTKRQRIILLHGFIKKTQKIPKRELETAKNRLKELTKPKKTWLKKQILTNT